MADDIMAIERTRLSLVNGSRNMSLMLDKLRSIDANEMANIRNIVKNIDVESGAIENEKALRLIEEIRDVDVFNFIQDIVDLMKHIESSQEQLDVYIKEFRKLV
ncbi:hypothetical protein PUV52_06950 [Leuconostoc mesenteroides]|uniref:Uncharacterized protein n=1 Tax=Leuconostoc mesenteroides subsp. mesenteroides (strain ATCC 8293 / DSM 20343 / BCRC 11652 / CCM 1803 / JCM 6124 / NCDO 523 / NBRC 100496 / NCIMB 8023 / NCTC 12954 / NRRL B-1118 / 37Y) TaxID=203120 RepID=Q03XD1_LEUMM|nr:hypothetical protein [Leuconostoc mesenteroides]ABJ62141.1 hypothetical protein LEUM_1041 [Leuconostoc mesenteroides subsp. mesenteroides ATCC 8293]MCT3043037.1 hypothetical protein [Leuconostoc mesenteroides]MDG9747147.1 hypothetical protein [Leuconostoc mesenteroides]QQB31059.1 hypothetical protein I6H90_09515 [Leuconostoc mesenteroides]STY37209.1 Uncharacterised protein [Leuconostoc mesenteroides]